MKEKFLSLENLISGMFPFALLIIAGLYLTFKTRGFQFRKLKTSIKFALFSKNGNKGEISSFGAVCNSLAATVGTGNIAGVAAAISIGGAGSVFWMWVSALVSMCVKSVEIVIAIHYRKKTKTAILGGPMHYITEGLGRKFLPLSFVFSIAGIFSAFTTGNITQINACVPIISQNFRIRLLIGSVIAFIVGIIITGGMAKITKFTTAVLPLMTVLYIIFCLSVIFKNFTRLDDAIFKILKGAFLPKAVTGGAVGSIYTVIITGAQKGIFSNEAGLGTAGMAHTLAEDSKIETQGLFGVFEVFVDTVVICSLTALTILCSGVIINYNEPASSGLVAEALSTLYSDLAKPTLSVMLLLFGVSSVIGWAAYGISCSDYVFGKIGKKIFVFLYPVFCILGAVLSTQTAWRLAEFFNGIMLIINLFAVLMLSKKAVEVLKE